MQRRVSRLVLTQRPRSAAESGGGGDQLLDLKINHRILHEQDFYLFILCLFLWVFFWKLLQKRHRDKKGAAALLFRKIITPAVCTENKRASKSDSAEKGLRIRKTITPLS